MSSNVCDHNDWIRIFDSVNSTLQCSNCTLKMTAGEYALFRALREQVAILRELVALQRAQS